MASRREFLEIFVGALGGILVYSLDRRPDLLNAQTLRVPLRFFTVSEARLIAAAAARVFPSDDAGPGANEAGVVVYIDRQLAGPYGRDRWRYTQAPFENGPPEVGYQAMETPRDLYRAGLKLLAGFDQLDAPAQDRALRGIEETLFFRLLRTHVIEGMFCDPMHGGNAGMIGWQLIGFPGPSMTFEEEVEKYYGLPFRPKPQSIEQASGRRVRPSEDEERPRPERSALTKRSGVRGAIK
jgi:gluconate 2-dehydrogenase gamma chain